MPDSKENGRMDYANAGRLHNQHERMFEYMNTTMPTLLSIRQVAQTGLISEYTLRSMVKQGYVPHVKVGTKVLINYEMFCNQLNDPNWMYNRKAG